MIVLDASAAVDWLLQTSAGLSIEKRFYSRNETLHVPHLLDGLNNLQLHPDQPIPHLPAAVSAPLSRWLEGEGHSGGHAVRSRF